MVVSGSGVEWSDGAGSVWRENGDGLDYMIMQEWREEKVYMWRWKRGVGGVIWRENGVIWRESGRFGGRMDGNGGIVTGNGWKWRENGGKLNDLEGERDIILD